MGLEDGKGVGGEVSDEKAKEGEERVEETIKPKVARTPKAPTAKEIEEHLPLHANYRDWCKWCVFGKGVSNHHVLSDDKERIGVTISMDHCFGVPEERDGEVPPTLVVYDDDKKAIWAYACENKTTSEGLIAWMMQNLSDAGYSGLPVTLKSDGDEGMIAIKHNLAVKRKVETPIINSPVRESKSNGAVERKIAKFKGQFRTLKLYFESRIGKKIPVDNPVATWLTTWTSEVMNKFQIQESGRTTYELMTGHRCKHLVIGFGEKVWFRLARGDKHDFDTDWDEGYFLGVITHTTDLLIGNSAGVFKCATVRRLPEAQAYDPKILDDINVTYSEYCKNGASTTKSAVVHGTSRGGVPDPDPIRPANEFMPRRPMLKKEYFDEFGKTGGCPGCVWLQNPIGKPRMHNEECRSRIMEKIAQTDKGRDMIERASDRLNQWTADQTFDVQVTAQTAQEGRKDDNMEGDQPVVKINEFPNAIPDSTVIEVGANGAGGGRRSDANGGDVQIERESHEDPRNIEEPILEDAQMKETDTRHSDSPVRRTPNRVNFEDILVPGIAAPHDERHPIPERAEATTRPAPMDAASPPPPKMRKLDPDDMFVGDAGGGTPESMDLIEERKILGALLSGVDITEVYSPERVAK